MNCHTQVRGQPLFFGMNCTFLSPTYLVTWNVDFHILLATVYRTISVRISKKNQFLAFDFSVLNLVVSRSLTRSLFSVSFFARWTTWRRLKLFKNRTGTAQQDTSNSSDQQQQHYWTSFKSSSLVATVTMPWTHSTTTSGTSPSWSTSLVSFIESWGPIQTFRYSVSPPFTKPCKEHFRCLFVHLLRPLCLKCLYVLFLDCAQIFTTNEERLRRDK